MSKTYEPMKDMTPGCEMCLACSSLCASCFTCLQAFGTTDVQQILEQGRLATGVDEKDLQDIRDAIEAQKALKP